MKTSNLFSLLSGRWFIHEEYGKSLLPSAFNIILGKSTLTINEEERQPGEMVLVKTSEKSSHERSAATFNQESNENDYVLVVDLKDPIYKYNQYCGPRGSKHKMSVMAQYENDPNMKGVVLDIDSGGGQVSGTPEFYDFVKNYSKPVVSYTDGLMCSAAYYIGSAADHIVANKRADTIGSIGTMIYFINMEGFYEKKGATIIREYATKSTDKNKNFEELIQGKPEGYIKNELDPITEDFHADMKAARTGLDDKVLAGGTWNAADSLSLGLIDEIGTLQTAINKVFELSKPNNQETINNNNNQNMKTNNLVQLLAVLGVESLEANENGVYLNQEQLDAIEQNITDQAAAVGTAEAATQVQEELVSNAATAAGSVHAAIQTALTEAEVEGAAEMTDEEGIIALSALVAEYGKADGATATTVAATLENKPINKNIVDGYDISSAMNN